MRSTRSLISFLRPYRKWAVIAPLFMLLEVALDLMQPRLIQIIVDDGIAHSNFPLVLHTGVWMMVLAFFGVLAGMGCTVYATLAAQGFGADLRRALFARVQRLSVGRLDTLESGAL